MGILDDMTFETAHKIERELRTAPSIRNRELESARISKFLYKGGEIFFSAAF